jgi:hypothetical protein
MRTIALRITGGIWRTSVWVLSSAISLGNSLMYSTRKLRSCSSLRGGRGSDRLRLGSLDFGRLPLRRTQLHPLERNDNQQDADHGPEDDLNDRDLRNVNGHSYRPPFRSTS